MIATIDRLKTISGCCLAGQMLDDEDARWLGTSLQRFLTHQTTSVADALNLNFPKGGVPWWQEFAIRKRNTAICELAACHLSDLCPSAKAGQVRTMSIRYAASAWRFDRTRDDMPVHYAGTPRELLWRAFKSGAIMPLGERQLRTILGD